MVPFFVGYALLIWFMTGAHRRRLIGWLWVLGGVLGLLSVAWLHILVSKWSGGRIYLPVLQAVLYPYTVIVTLVSVFIASMPRLHKTGCRVCGYDLEALPDAERCPECGTPSEVSFPRRTYRESGLPRENLRTTDHPNAARQPTPSSSTPTGTPATSNHR